MTIAPRDFRDEEPTEPRSVVEAQGRKVWIASASVEEARGMRGLRVKPDPPLDRVRVTDYDAVVFVGGSGASCYWRDETAWAIAREAVARGEVLGAICIAPVTLANAGVLPVDRPWNWNWKRKLLGFSFLPGKRIRIRLAPETVERLKAKLRKFTSRTWSVAMPERISDGRLEAMEASPDPLSRASPTASDDFGSRGGGLQQGILALVRDRAAAQSPRTPVLACPRACAAQGLLCPSSELLANPDADPHVRWCERLRGDPGAYSIEFMCPGRGGRSSRIVLYRGRNRQRVAGRGASVLLGTSR